MRVERELSDAEALRRSRRDPDAICVLYDRHLPRLVATLARAAGDREIAFDVAQETFARALESGHRVQLPADGSAWPWLWTVARNLLRDWKRRDLVDAGARMRLGIRTVAYDAQTFDELLARVDSEELHEPLAQALDELPPEQRRAVVGRVALGLDYGRLAEGFGTSEQVFARPRLARASGPANSTFRRKTVNATTDPILAFRLELRGAAQRRIAARRRHRLVLLAALATGALVSGLSIAATGWLTGKPAPAPVVSDFEAYTPQLGFHPEPGKAVLVAQDGAIKLYATTNREGTYCYTLDSPWKHPDVHDGGTCIPPDLPSGPISAGIVGLSRTRDGAQATYVVAGRVEDSSARAIRFTAPGGEQIERSLGSSGFYVAAFTTTGSCQESWTPSFTALDGGGSRLVQATIPLERKVSPTTCLFEGLPVSRGRL